MQVEYACWTKCKQKQLFTNEYDNLSPKQDNEQLVRNEENFAVNK